MEVRANSRVANNGNSTFSIRKFKREEELRGVRNSGCKEFHTCLNSMGLLVKLLLFPLIFSTLLLSFIDLLHMNLFLKMKEDRIKSECESSDKTFVFLLDLTYHKPNLIFSPGIVMTILVIFIKARINLRFSKIE